MKVLKKIRNIFAVVFLAIFLLFIVAISTLLLSRNDYGITQFNDKALIIIDEKISNNNYNAGELVLVQEKTIDQLQIGDEVFVYSSNQKTKKVEIIVAKISTINKEDKYNPSVTLENDKGTWGIEFIAGTTYKKYEKVGRLLSIIQSKWIFFVLLIVPCFFVLLYEIYLLVVLIKYDDGLDEEDEEKKLEPKEEPNKEITSESKEPPKEENPKVEEVSKEVVDEKKEESKEEVKEQPESKEDNKDSKEENKSEDKKDNKEDNKEDKKDNKENKSEDKKEDKKDNNESVNYDELAKKIATSDANNEEIEKQLLELKEKMMKEKEEKEKKAKQEKIDSLLKEISELKDELDK